MVVSHLFVLWEWKFSHDSQTQLLNKIILFSQNRSFVIVNPYNTHLRKVMELITLCYKEANSRETDAVKLIQLVGGKQ